MARETGLAAPMDVTWPLVGRSGELARVAGVLQGGGRAVLIAGEAGVGKTRLAAECLALAAEAGLVPLRIGATRAASGLPSERTRRSYRS